MDTDQKARDMAQAALSAIEKHESVCAERILQSYAWREDTSAKLEKIGQKVGGFYNRLWSATIALVGILLSIVAYLLTHPHAGL